MTVILCNFVIAHIPRKNNTAADYLFRVEMDSKEKLILKIRDLETRPNEVNVQSAGLSEEEQVFFTEDDDETEEQICERKNTDAVITSKDKRSQSKSTQYRNMWSMKSQILLRSCVETIEFWSNSPKTIHYNNSNPKFKIRIFRKRFSSTIFFMNTISTIWTG